MSKKIFVTSVVLASFLSVQGLIVFAEEPTSAPLESSVAADLSPEETVIAPEEKETPSLIPDSAKMVKSIDVQGNKTIAIAAILSKIKTRVGQEYRESIISDDLKRLYNTGHFSDVTIDHEDHDGGYKVIIKVVEKPIIDEITFSKLRYFNKRSILSKLQTKPGKFLDNKTLKDDINTIEEMYKKKGLTQVTVETETFSDDTTNKTSLHFIIREGYRVKIKRIYVYGNTAFSDKRIIKVIKSRPAWIFNSGFLKEELLQEDMERVQAFYEQQGYIDAKASYTIDQQNQGRTFININIEEGKRYYVGTITIEGNKILTQREVLAAMKSIKEGNIFSRAKLDEDIGNIQTAYFDRGYIFSKTEESTSLNSENGKVDVRLSIEEGGIAYINKVKIQGNTRTRDIVIRRELRMFPGDQFDGAKLRRSKERLRNLGYFEDVSYDIEDTDSYDQKNLVVQVKEAKTGSFSFGGGYSTVDQIVGFIEIEQKNFDITNWPTFTGGGQNLLLRAETGSTRNNLRLSFTEPWLFDYPISGGFDAYRMQRDRERDVGYAYDETRTGGGLRLGKEFTEHVSGGVNYHLEEIKISNLDSNVSADLAAEEGENVVSSLGFTTMTDYRDSQYNSTKGWVWNNGADVAGSFLGGDKDFYRLQTSGSYYIPVTIRSLISVLEFRSRLGIVDAYGDSTRVPIFERFFAGGARSIRGYDERTVGPLDDNTQDPIGGEALFVGNIEYTIPLVDFLKLATFFDTGNVWPSVDDFASGNLKSGAGVGLRVKTPIGPINLDYGYPLDEEPGEEERSGKFYFSVSRGF